MIRLDEDSLICDLAETYHILDYKVLSPRLVAVLASGLSDDSRIKKKISKRRLSLDTALTAAMVDRLSQILWMKTEDAKKNRNRPKLILDLLEHPVERNHQSFNSIEAFEAKKAKIMRS